MNRRDLAKGLAAGLTLKAGSAFGAQSTGTDTRAAGPSVELKWTQVDLGIWKATIGVPEDFTPVSSRLIPSAGEKLRILPVVSVAPLGVVRGSVSQRGCLLELPLKTQESIFGFGLQLLSFEQRGKKKVIRVNADPKLDTGDSHSPVPFYVTSRGYGILIDSTRQTTFYCGDARPKPARALVPGSAAVNTPEETHTLELGEPGRVSVEVPRATGVDVYLFAGPTMLNAVQRYNLFSGGGIVPPDWGLGFWYRPDTRATQQSVTALAHELRERKIPCDVIGLEGGWQSHAYSCTFAWDKVRFPDPHAFLEGMNGMQLKVNVWEHAFTHPSSPLFPALLPISGNYGVWGGLVPDFAGQPARKAFGDYHGKTLIDAGICGFKLDECDGSDFTGGWSFPDMSRFPSGVDGEQMHAVFGLRYQAALLAQFRERNLPTYSLVRSSGALAAPYPFVLYSDLYDHRQFVRGIATSGFSGLLWCPEVRDAKSEEDLIRRLQTVVFSPLAMINAWYIKNPPWKQMDRKKNNANELAEHWEALEERCREVLGWRMQLIPYMLSAFLKYEADGTPPFRAPVLDFPDDPKLVAVDDQFMIGDRMMVAPIFAGEDSRKIVLPPGTWHDLWTGERHQGSSTIIMPRSTEKIPVFVKSGSVLPMAGIGQSTASLENSRLTMYVYGDGSLPWTMGGVGTQEFSASWSSATHTGAVHQAAKSPYKVVEWKSFT